MSDDFGPQETSLKIYLSPDSVHELAMNHELCKA